MSGEYREQSEERQGLLHRHRGRLSQRQQNTMRTTFRFSVTPSRMDLFIFKATFIIFKNLIFEYIFILCYNRKRKTRVGRILANHVVLCTCVSLHISANRAFFYSTPRNVSRHLRVLDKTRSVAFFWTTAATMPALFTVSSTSS